jgi:hypothetical protein
MCNGDSINKSGQAYEDMINKIQQKLPWVPIHIGETSGIPHGDMPGDKVVINPTHVMKAELIFPRLLELLIPVLKEQPYQRAVVSVCGGSGVGKSEIASLLSYYLNTMNVGSYTLSGDNYPHRIPKYNDAERLRIFRQTGIRGLIANGQYTGERFRILKEFQLNGQDANPELVKDHPWLAVYQSEGRSGLKNYLGTPNEIDFRELSGIITQFKNGAPQIHLKRMGREETELWYDAVDFSKINILIIEWTHGNNHSIQGIDIPILLHSTPQETLEHRRARNRDGATDSPFTTMVLTIEQELLVFQAPKAKIIVSKSGELLSFNNFIKTMLRE